MYNREKEVIVTHSLVPLVPDASDGGVEANTEAKGSGEDAGNVYAYSVRG